MSVLARMASQAWDRRGLGGAALWAMLVPPALMYGLGARGRNFLYDHGWRRPRRVRSAVVSVGNLTVGGTGKTPVVIWIAGELERLGFRVGVLSRGYGRRSRGVRLVADGGKCLIDVAEAGDEPALVGRRIRGVVVVGERRAAAAKIAEERGAQVLVMDDGFQHRALARDFDLLLLDRHRPFANGWTLPAGPLREPGGHALRAHAMLVVDRSTGTQGIDDRGTAEMRSAIPCFRAALTPRALVVPDGDEWIEKPLAELAGRRVMAVSGVANPDAFYEMLRRWGAQIVGVLQFPDHHWYDAADWRTITTAARAADLVVTTEKDLVKLERFPFAKGTVAALRLGVEVDSAARLLEAVSTAVKKVLSR